MTDCIVTPATGLSAMMWQSLDPRKGTSMTGQSAMSLARQIAMGAGLSAEAVAQPETDDPALANIATLKP